MSLSSEEWVTLNPTLSDPDKTSFQEAAYHLISDPRAELELPDAGSNVELTTLKLMASIQLLRDLSRQGWRLRVKEGEVQALCVGAHGKSHLEEKARLRAQETLKRDEQLREPSTRRFILGLEAARPISVRGLLRDGKELAARLCEMRRLEGEAQLKALACVISPYLQVVTADGVCKHSGLRLQDIWRYFRHGWSNQYTTTPGRTFAFLIRDRAAPRHPIIGIGALGSSIVQLKERDLWIGWHPERFLEQVSEEPTAEIAAWLLSIIEVAIDELYLRDFLEEGLLDETTLTQPTVEVIKALEKYALDQRACHQREVVNNQELKRALSREITTDYEAEILAQTALYKSKRAASLASLLRSRRELKETLSSEPTAEELSALLLTAKGRDTIKRILRKARGDRVGVSIADITVCGAVAPYTHLLGGKLVSMISSSPELVARYEERYQGQVSQIASKMAGRTIIRSSTLALVGTTSLYGVGSSQYNRVKVPTSRLGGRSGDYLKFFEVGRSAAYGTAHFSAQTLMALNEVVTASGLQQVNSIFGEGVSPKLRKVRDGLKALGLPDNSLLQHGRNRIIYMVPLVHNLRRFLLGLDRAPQHLVAPDLEGETTEAIADWWRERWLSMRIRSDDVLGAVESHVDSPSQTHGGRVSLPTLKEPEGDQPSLFNDL